MTYFFTNHARTLSRSFLFLATKLQIFILCSNDSRQFIDGWVTCQILHLPNWQVVVKSHLPTEILTCIGRLAGASISACGMLEKYQYKHTITVDRISFLLDFQLPYDPAIKFITICSYFLSNVANRQTNQHNRKHILLGLDKYCSKCTNSHIMLKQSSYQTNDELLIIFCITHPEGYNYYAYTYITIEQNRSPDQRTAIRGSNPAKILR